MATANFTAPEIVERYRGRALLVGAAALVVGLLLAFLMGGVVHVFRAWLAGFVFCAGLSVGALAWLMLGHMSGGAWALTSRRLFEAAAGTIPLVALFFIPIIISLFVHPHSAAHPHGESLYEWSNHWYAENDPVIRWKRPFLNEPFFIIRGVIYFAVWFLLARFLRRSSLEQDTSGDPRIRRRMQDWSGPGLLLFGLTVTFAAVDWGMSLEPHWFSTIYGLILMAGWGLSALALAITIASFLGRHEPMSHAYQPLHFHDWGKLLLAMVMLYAYFSFSQFLIIWAGNLPEEIPFYLRRLRHGWEYVGLALILFHFALPFALLLSRGLKRTPRLLRQVAVLMLLMRAVDLVFLFAPAAHQGGEDEFRAFDLVRHFVPMLLVTAGLGGVWLWHYFGQLRTRPLLPLGEPNLDKALAAAEHH